VRNFLCIKNFFTLAELAFRHNSCFLERGCHLTEIPRSGIDRYIDSASFCQRFIDCGKNQFGHRCIDSKNYQIVDIVIDYPTE